MVHLAVHLPDDALLRGPVQYGWMYPIERRLYTLKRYVRNRARPEGSIAEAYIADECLTFCSRYMDDVETRFNREPRNKGFSDEEAYGVDVFGHGVNFTSAPELVYDENGIDQMVWYVLNNCSQVEKYVKMFRDELESKGVPNIERMLRQGFQIWFRNHIMRLRYTNQEGDLFDHDGPKKGSKDNNGRTIDMAPGGIKPRTKRVFADQDEPSSAWQTAACHYEGRIRPVTPILAAKFATECNIAVRTMCTCLSHGRNMTTIPGSLSCLKENSAKFDINTDDAAVKNACLEMMKKALRQQRYRLKKQYFDPFPLHLVRKTSPIKSTSDDRWNDLVEHFGKLTCEHNKDNRGRVKFHQTTGSRSYMVHVENLGDKYIDQEPDALDLFKECHYSKKKQGYTSTVQLAITQMENKRSTPREGEQPVSMTQVVSDVLAENTKKNRFLRMWESKMHSLDLNVEAQLEAERTANAELRSLVNIQREQMDVLSKQLKEAELIRTREQEEMKKKQDAMDAKLELMLSRFNEVKLTDVMPVNL
ncbi:LOW QUALITY PROTEIN: hypothetical protein U9M48_014113 [Paspalum notatum var. saurae]|uniref:DUF4218 domain-containing protein n=1 Tax=Paspalum notatum var. saurae TaxID=547442 RepID=A0AAQ3WK74_PASNO